MSRPAVVAALLLLTVPRSGAAFERQRSIEIAVFPAWSSESDPSSFGPDKTRLAAGGVLRFGYDVTDSVQLRLAAGAQPMGPLAPGWQPYAAGGARWATGGAELELFLGGELGVGWSRYSRDVDVAWYLTNGPRAPASAHLDLVFTLQMGTEWFVARDHAVGLALWLSAVSPNYTFAYGPQLSYRYVWGF